MASNIPSNIEDLKLGKSQAELIQNTKTHIDKLYDKNSEQATSISIAQKKADDAYLLASRKHKIVAYDTLSAMINALNSANETDFDIGDEIYIKDASYTRDFWVSAKQDTKYTNQTNESGFKVDNFEKGYVGYFELSILDERPEITNMVTSDENITDSKIVLGAGNKKVKDSKIAITTTAPSLTSTNNTVPTSQAVFSAIDSIASSKITPVATSLTAEINQIKNGTTTVGKATQATQDENGNPITSTYATKEELKTAGTVKTVSVNGGTPVPPDDNGNINLSVSVTSGEELKALYDEVTSTDSRWTTYKIGTTAYDAILVDDTNVVYDVLNDEGYTIITQIVRDTSNKKLYICFVRDTTKSKSYFLRQLSGNAVGGGSSGDTSQLEARVGILETNVKALESKSNLYLYKVKLTGAAYAQDKNDDGTAILYLSFYSKTKPTSIPENFVSFNSDAKIQLWNSINSYLLRGYVVVNEYHMPILDASTSYSSNIIEVNVITPADGATMPYNIQAISIDSYLFTTVQ